MSYGKYVATMTREQCLAIARLVMSAASLEEIATEFRLLASRLPGNASDKGTWKYYVTRFADALTAGRIPNTIFAKGNSKLPFYAFSTLPIVTCPGAGACIEYCYSLRAWRYPAAFLRQCANTLRLRFDKRSIIDKFAKLPKGITLRLYVDGDFDSASTMLFWFNLLNQRPDILCYGYSKSWELFLNWGREFPANYVLNVSNGSRYDGAPGMRESMLALPITRGEFLAVKLRRKHAKGFAKYESPDYHRDVRESALAAGLGNVFSCRGKCGECTGRGHACGVRNDNGSFLVPITIAIGIH